MSTLPVTLEILAMELNHAATLLALAADKVRCVDYEGDRFDLLTEAERFDALLEKLKEANHASRSSSLSR